jgi:hypothetical protein
MLHPNAIFTPHMGQGNGRGLSPRLWSRLNGSAMSPDGASNVYAFFDDFLNFGSIVASGMVNGYYGYIEDDATAGAIQNIATAVGGVLKMLTSKDAADGDNHDTTLITGGNTGAMGVISNTAGSDKMLLFEARFKLASVTDGDGSFFVGMCEEGLAAANGVIADSTGHVLASKDLIGFLVTEDNNDSLKFVYRKAGQAAQTVFTYGTALAANTWYKVGFAYDPKAPASKRITVYIDNMEQSTYVTATNIAAATFPNGEELAVVASLKNSADNDPQVAYLDWVGFAQVA